MKHKITSNLRTILSKILILGIVLVETSLQQVTVVSTTEYPDQHTKNWVDISQRLKNIESKIDTCNNLKLQQLKKCESNENPVYPTSCKEVKTRGNTNSGIYLIKPKLSQQDFAVFCDMETEDGGWTYFLNRFDRSTDFYLPWKEYKSGFGSLTGEHWLGLEYLHQITGSEISELFVEMKDWDGKTIHARYDAFVVGSENQGYILKAVGEYSGNAGEHLAYSSGMKFTTIDKDQDLRERSNCANDAHAPWWHRDCTRTILTGRYFTPETYTETYRWQAMSWGVWDGPQHRLTSLKMMLRPKNVR